MKHFSLTILAFLYAFTMFGQEIQTFQLTNDMGMKAVVTNYGARLMSLYAYNWNGRLEPVVKGYQHVSDYKDNPTLGATVMSFDGKVNNTLSEKVWDVVVADKQSVTFRYIAEGEEGKFDGKMNFTVTYTLSDQNALDIDYRMISTAPTQFKLSNGIVFNLSGDLERSILNQNLWINSCKTNLFNDKFELTGEQENVRFTPLNFIQPREIGERIGELEDGYNHAFQLRYPSNIQKPAAILFDAQSGRVMTIYTYEPTLLVNSYGKKSKGISFQPLHTGYDENKERINTNINPGQVFHAATVFIFTTDPPLIMKTAVEK
ncbi:aldose 1-epimerase [Prevotella disiens JCM 6334 = ATCC 29426]|uniref:Aldose 1-epimerase n=2 Tax=Prevotella disiens TaxID=28130 RepID=A0A379DZR1_9BACT|nr:aldose 1-epimerase [Prevotella disiens]ERJ80541.1 aldose 1-epimerase [Prevotella disiens JCM 6334 = ATCC 29426]SUB85640.1 Aldose 1-epimerase precursor [Prevotella disiens]